MDGQRAPERIHQILKGVGLAHPGSAVLVRSSVTVDGGQTQVRRNTVFYFDHRRARRMKQVRELVVV